MAQMNKEGEDTYSARHDFFDSLGKRSPFVLAPLVSPLNTGEPYYWPRRPAWSEIMLDDESCTVFASDGLSDQWDENSPIDWKDDSRPDPNFGLGFELVFGSMDLSWEVILSAIMQTSNMFSSNPFFWLPEFKACGEIEKKIARDFPELGWLEQSGLSEIGTSSTVVKGKVFPDTLVGEDGYVGVLIANGITNGLPQSFQAPAGKIYVLEMVLLHPDELAYIIAYGIPARVEILHRLRALPARWCSSAKRPSVVPTPPEGFDDPQLSEYDIINAIASWPPINV